MKLKALLVLPLLLLSGCEGNQSTIYLERHGLLENNLVSLEDDITLFTKSADNDLLITLSETKQDYVVYTYSENCSYCAFFLPILKNYLLETHHLIYSYNATSNNLNALNEALPDVYSVLATPNMSFFKDGQKISELASSRFQNAHNFKIAFDSYVTSSPIAQMDDLTSILNVFDNESNYVLYFYEDELSYEFYKEHFYPDFNDIETLKPYRIDLSRLSDSEIEKINQKFYMLEVSAGHIYFNIDNKFEWLIRNDMDIYLSRYEEIVANLSND